MDPGPRPAWRSRRSRSAAGSSGSSASSRSAFCASLLARATASSCTLEETRRRLPPATAGRRERHDVLRLAGGHPSPPARATGDCGSRRTHEPAHTLARAIIGNARHVDDEVCGTRRSAPRSVSSTRRVAGVDDLGPPRASRRRARGTVLLDVSTMRPVFAGRRTSRSVCRQRKRGNLQDVGDVRRPAPPAERARGMSVEDRQVVARF